MKTIKKVNYQYGLNKELDIESSLDSKGRLEINLLIYNENVLKNFKVGDYTNSLVKDATVFNLAGKQISDIKFEVSFNLNILDKTGRKSVLKVKLELPDASILENGTYVERLEISDFNFKV